VFNMLLADSHAESVRTSVLLGHEHRLSKPLGPR
jgi:hypothetical protein